MRIGVGALLGFVLMLLLVRLPFPETAREWGDVTGTLIGGAGVGALIGWPLEVRSRRKRS
jgi:hypothetical protein